jgi:hypothetical protein
VVVAERIAVRAGRSGAALAVARVRAITPRTVQMVLADPLTAVAAFADWWVSLRCHWRGRKTDWNAMPPHFGHGAGKTMGASLSITCRQSEYIHARLRIRALDDFIGRTKYSTHVLFVHGLTNEGAPRG